LGEGTTKFWTLRRKVWAGIGALALAGLGAAGHYLPDFGLRYGLIRSLHDLGWARVSVSDADLSLWGGAIVVRRVEVGEELGRALGIDGVALKFRWKPLLSRRVSVERLDLQGVTIDIKREGGKLIVNGLPVAMAGESGGGSEWSYDVTSLKLSGSRLDVTDGDVKAVIEVDSLEIADLKSWEPQVPARFSLRGRVNGAAISLDGTATPFATAPQLAARIALDALDLASVQELARRAGSDRLSGRASARLDLAASAAGLRGEGRLTLDSAAWAAGATRLKAAALTMELSRFAWNGTLDLAGSLEAEELALEDGGLAINAGRARVQARSAGFDPKADRLAWDGTLHAERHALTLDGLRVSHGVLDWTGTSRIDFAANAASLFRAEGRAEASDAAFGQDAFHLQAGRLTADGVFEHARAEGVLPPLAGRMTLSAEQVLVHDDGRDWLRAEKLDAHELTLASGRATLDRIEARRLAALAKPKGGGAYPPRLEARSAVVERAALTADGAISATSLSVAGAVLRATRTKAGFVGLPEGGADEEGAQKLALTKLKLGGRMEFEDHSLSEPVRLRLDGLEATMVELDTAQPERDSAFTLKARIGAAALSAQGRARPFAAHPGGDMKGKVTALELPALSPYAADTLGVHLQTGQLDADIAMAAEAGKLDGAMVLTLSELFIAQPDPNAPLAKKADMPVETVLDLLRDSENRIRLTIPVRGDFANPDFDVSDAVGQAVGGALKSTVFTTLKVAFPLAGLISLVIDDSESRRLALEPLVFAAGAEALGEVERRTLISVAELMASRPGVKLTLCGVAQRAEWPALVLRKREAELGILAKLQKLVGSAPQADDPNLDMNRLTELADARAQAAKAFLVDQSGIDPGRLFTCRPRIEDAGKAASPRVDLVL